LSDFAAMSGLPRHALITLVAPAEREARWIRQLYAGLNRAAARFEVAIAGGETSGTAGPLVISVAAAGWVEKERCVLRRGGRAGDILFVTGRLGGSGGDRHLDFLPRIEEARWLTQHFRIRAMMDLSDGLGADLPRLAKASGVGFAIEEQSLPRARGSTVPQAINQGEDYELLFAVSPEEATPLEKKWRKRFPHLPLSRIGSLIPPSAFRAPPSFHGYRHFQ
jgi:thiamine-monophosphate kinase